MKNSKTEELHNAYSRPRRTEIKARPNTQTVGGIRKQTLLITCTVIYNTSTSNTFDDDCE